MAVQLERFLKRQLKNPNLPDRGFIEATLAETLAYQKRMGGAERDGLPTYRGKVNEYFRSLKTGPLVDQNLIERALSDTGHAIHRPSLETYADLLTIHIKRDGDESIAHLCLPTVYRNFLLRQNIRRVDQVKEIVSNGQITKLRYLRGAAGQREVHTALEDFDRLREQQTTK